MLPKETPGSFLELLANAGYFVGHVGHGWGPGEEARGRRSDAGGFAGPAYRSVGEAVQRSNGSRPWAIWHGSFRTHRPFRHIHAYPLNATALMPPWLPRPVPPAVATDYLAHAFCSTSFDQELNSSIPWRALESTVVIVTSDHGRPFPREKASPYDGGVSVALAIRIGRDVPVAGGPVRRGLVLDVLTSAIDLAPTILELAGVLLPAKTAEVPMDGRSLLPLITRGGNGRHGSRTDPRGRPFLLWGQERVGAENNKTGYPLRAIRTREYLYISNMRPERDAATCDQTFPVRVFLRSLNGSWFNLSCAAAKPREELYDLRADPAQIRDVAGSASYTATRQELAAQLHAELVRTADPRMEPGGGEAAFEHDKNVMCARYPHVCRV